MMITPDDPMTEPVVRRIEVFTGAGHRRRWPADLKARIVAEAELPGETVSGVARRHGLEASQVFAWRRELRRASQRQAGMSFAPVVVERLEPPAPGRLQRRVRHSSRAAGVIELEVDGVLVRIGRGAETRAISAVIGALRRGS